MRLLIAIESCLLLMIVVAPPASAQRTNAPPGNSGVDQYLETIPDAGGSRPPTSTSDGPALPARIVRRLEAAGDDGDTVAELVESTGSKRVESRSRPRQPSNDRRGESPPSIAESVVSPALAGSGDGGMGLLLPAILVSSAVAAAAFAVTRRRRG